MWNTNRAIFLISAVVLHGLHLIQFKFFVFYYKFVFLIQILLILAVFYQVFLLFNNYCQQIKCSEAAKAEPIMCSACGPIRNGIAGRKGTPEPFGETQVQTYCLHFIFIYFTLLLSHLTFGTRYHIIQEYFLYHCLMNK